MVRTMARSESSNGSTYMVIVSLGLGTHVGGRPMTKWGSENDSLGKERRHVTRERRVGR
jgi:hypothetical protein